MDVAEIFDTFGVDAGEAMVLDKAYLPSSFTFAEVLRYSKKVDKPLYVVKRCKHIYLFNGDCCGKQNYDAIDERKKKFIEDALEKADSKNRSYCGQ